MPTNQTNGLGNQSNTKRGLGHLVLSYEQQEFLLRLGNPVIDLSGPTLTISEDEVVELAEIGMVLVLKGHYRPTGRAVEWCDMVRHGVITRLGPAKSGSS